MKEQTKKTVRKYEKLDKKLDLFDEKLVRANAKGNESMVIFARRLCVCLDERELTENGFLREIENAKFDNKVKVGKASLNAYLKGEQVPSADKLYTIAKTLGVSTDYLLGLSDFPSINDDYKKVNKLTGLSENVIDVLKKQKDTMFFVDSMKTINYLIENEQKYWFLRQLFSFLWFDSEKYLLNTINKKEHMMIDSEPSNLKAEMMLNFHKAGIDQTLFKIREDVENQKK